MKIAPSLAVALSSPSFPFAFAAESMPTRAACRSGWTRPRSARRRSRRLRAPRRRSRAARTSSRRRRSSAASRASAPPPPERTRSRRARSACSRSRVVRSDGAVDEKKAHVASANGIEWTPKANLEWAVQSLREIDAKRPNDPTVQADLGEALSKTATGQAEALKLLQGLAQKDLMGSPHAYAALAKLRTAERRLAGAEAAIKRCEEMSKTPGVCKPARRAEGLIAIEGPDRTQATHPTSSRVRSRSSSSSRSRRADGLSEEAEPRPDPSPPMQAARAPSPRLHERRARRAASAAHGKELVLKYECNRCHDGSRARPGGRSGQALRALPQGHHGGPVQRASAASIARWKPRVQELADAPSLEATGKRFTRAWVEELPAPALRICARISQQFMPRLAISRGRRARHRGVPRARRGSRRRRDSRTRRRDRRRRSRQGPAAPRDEGLRELPRDDRRRSRSPSSNPPAMDGKDVRARAHARARSARTRATGCTPSRLVAWLERSDGGEARQRDAEDRALRRRGAGHRRLHADRRARRGAPPKPRPRACRSLTRKVTFKEVDEKVFHRTCWHCHSEPDYAIGDGGPGNSGGFGFKPRGLNLSATGRSRRASSTTRTSARASSRRTAKACRGSSRHARAPRRRGRARRGRRGARHAARLRPALARRHPARRDVDCARSTAMRSRRLSSARARALRVGCNSTAKITQDAPATPSVATSRPAATAAGSADQPREPTRARETGQASAS